MLSHFNGLSLHHIELRLVILFFKGNCVHQVLSLVVLKPAALQPLLIFNFPMLKVHWALPVVLQVFKHRIRIIPHHLPIFLPLKVQTNVFD